MTLEERPARDSPDGRTDSIDPVEDTKRLSDGSGRDNPERTKRTDRGRSCKGRILKIGGI